MALVKCKDCGRDVSTEADKCPNCGAPTPKQATVSKSASGTALGCLVAIGIVFVLAIIGKSGGGGSVNKSVADDLLAKQSQCRENLQKVEELGVKITDRDGSTEAEYDEVAWAALTHDDKIKQALLIYCAKMPTNGHYTVLIYGLHDGKSMGSVVDGNYFD